MSTTPSPTIQVDLVDVAPYYQDLGAVAVNVSLSNRGDHLDSLKAVRLVLPGGEELHPGIPPPQIMPRPLDVEGLRLEPGSLVSGMVYFSIPEAARPLFSGGDEVVAGIAFDFVRTDGVSGKVRIQQVAALRAAGVLE